MKTLGGLRVVPAGTPDAQSALALAVGSAGLIKGARAMSFLITWAIAVRQLGHDLGEQEGGHLSAAVREHAAYWRQTERTSWRDVAAWRQAFPGEESPAALALQLLEVYDREMAKARREDATGLAARVLVVPA